MIPGNLVVMSEHAEQPITAPDHTSAAEPSTSSTRLWPLVRLCAVVAGVCSLTWISERFSGSPLPPRSAYVSELFALGQPWAGYLRAVDAIAGASLMTGVFLAWTASREMRRTASARTRRLLAATMVGLGLFGLATLVDAAMPMSCTPSTSKECVAAEAAGEVPLRHQVHSASSSLATVGAMVGFVSLATAAGLRRHRRLGPWRLSASRLAVTITAVLAVSAYVLTTVWVLVEIAGGTPTSPLYERIGFGSLGWSQRLQVSLSAVCLFLIALLLPHPHTRWPHTRNVHRESESTRKA